MSMMAGAVSAADTDGVWPFIAGEIREEDAPTCAGTASLTLRVWGGL